MFDRTTYDVKGKKTNNAIMGRHGSSHLISFGHDPVRFVSAFSFVGVPSASSVSIPLRECFLITGRPFVQRLL